MFYNGDCSMWAVPGSIESLQESASSDVTASVLASLKDKGLSVFDYYLEAARRRAIAATRLYNLHDVPDIWPLVLAKLVARHLPLKWRRTLEHSRIGLVNSAEVNAILREGDIGIMAGLQNLFYACCFAGAVFEMWCHDVDQHALTLANETKVAFERYLTAESASEIEHRFGEAMVARSELAIAYPKERAALEQFPAACANEMLMFVMVHELAHKLMGHRRCRGAESQKQESGADGLAMEALKDFRTIGFGPFPGAALSMSLLEANDRLRGLSLAASMRVEADSTHPSHPQRRAHILKLAIPDLTSDATERQMTRLQVAIQHVIHSNVSSILVRKGLEPLAPFHTSSSVCYFGPPNIPERLLLCEESVVEMELTPYKEAGLNRFVVRGPIWET